MISYNLATDEHLDYFGFYCAILAFEFVVISFVTGQVRLKTKSFANPEDALKHGGIQFCRENDEVERIRRIAQNDLECVPMFLFVTLILACTPVSIFWYSWTMRSYTFLRILYSIAYAYKFPAPSRSVIYSLALYFVHVPATVTVVYYSII